MSIESPFFRQYAAIKREQPPDTILLVQTGGYYNAFDGDADALSSVLHRSVTCMLDRTAYVLRHEELETALGVLLRKGRRVAVATCVEDTRTSRHKVIRREVQIIAEPCAVKFGDVVSMTLAPEWYNAILYGQKRVEYRDMTDYWESRLWANGRAGRISAVVFYLGRSSERMSWKVAGVVRNAAEEHFAIHLLERIS